MPERVAIVATVRDERTALGPFLDGLDRQTRPPDEIVIVDGGSTDGTYEQLEAQAVSRPRLRVVRRPGANISEGRNHAIALADSPVLAVTDAGTVAHPDWLAELAAPFDHGDGVAAGVVAGYFRPGGRTWFERSLGAIITPHLREIDADAFLPSSRSVAFTRRWWEEAGGYPEWLTHCEDLVFDLELRRRGAPFTFRPSAVVTWTTRSSLPGFFRQYYLYARGDGRAGLWPRRHAVRYTAYLSGVGLLLGWNGRRRRLRRMLLVAGGAGYLSKFYRRVWRHLGPSPDLPLAAALVPVVVATGDVAKMIGYPVGRMDRRRATGAAR